MARNKEDFECCGGGPVNMDVSEALRSRITGGPQLYHSPNCGAGYGAGIYGPTYYETNYKKPGVVKKKEENTGMMFNMSFIIFCLIALLVLYFMW